MKTFTLITALSLCSFSWISVSLSGSQTVEVKPGQDVTLLCNNVVSYGSTIFWFRLVGRANPNCISVKNRNGNVTYYKRFQTKKFEMRSTQWSTVNTSTVSLKIKDVDFSDSGLYFCGFYIDGGPTFSVIHLKVEGSDDVNNKCTKSDGIIELMSVILGALTVLLMMVIVGLVVKNRKLQTADTEEQNPEQSENVGSDDLNYAAVTFQSKAKRREPEPNAVYANTR